MKLTSFKVMSFDCYGTLIDWETGLLTALQPWITRQSLVIDDAGVLEKFSQAESAQEAATPTMLYRDVLAAVLHRLAAAWQVTATDAEAIKFGASVGEWPAFPDSGAALADLKRHYRLVILSNVDRQSFRGSNAQLGVTFDAIHTADEIGSYKPDARNLKYLIDQVEKEGFDKSQILHVAQSLYHDHVPAQAAGLATCWINRRAGRPGSGATKIVKGARYDREFNSLKGLADACREEFAASR